MKITLVKSRARETGWALLVVMSLAATGLLLVASMMNWTNENSAVAARNSEYFASTYAAEAATEKAFGSIVQDDQNYGQGWVFTKTGASSYSSLIPTASDNPYWTNYQFSGGTTPNTVLVECLNTNVTNYAGPPYSGLQYVGGYYEIIANAKKINSPYGITATVGQQIILGQIPIFQFAIFYNDTLEIDPGAPMNINGNVHCNTNIYIDPSSLLIFSNDVSATGTLNLTENPLDPSGRTLPTPTNMYVFDGSACGGVNPLNLPVGTNVSGITTNNDAAVNAILQPPPPGESAASSIGTNRLYNQVDMIITISNGNVITVTSGVAVDNAATTISNNQWSSFISTNGSFYNMRDGSTVDPVDINVGALRKWSATNTILRPLLASAPSRSSTTADVQSIYVADQRFLSNTIVTTNGYTYTTNTVSATTSNYPGSGTYYPPVTTNTIQSTSSSFPATGTYVPPILSTNVISTNSATQPTSGTYMGSVTTNTTTNTTTTYPAAGTYTGTVTTNISTNTSTTYPGAGTYTGTVTTNITYTTTTTSPAAGTYTGTITTNTTTTTTTAYPTAGTYTGAVTTNTTTTTTTTRPTAGTYTGTITTNTTTTTTTTSPTAGTYTGTVTTNTTYTTTTTYPTAGTYTGTVTTNKSGKTITGYSYYLISGYTYNLISGYTYNLITNYTCNLISGYSYNLITGYSYNQITGYTYRCITYGYNLITGYIYNLITTYTYTSITGVVTNAILITNYVQYAEQGIVLTNGGVLPSNGLSVVTPDPLYIVGNWNVTNNSGQGMLQTYNVADSMPSAVYADAVTILSPAWNPNNSTNSISSRVATPDTVNAAILTGIVPSNGLNYSGGAENFPRFQENWGSGSGVNFYYNGSMVEMFASQIASDPWPGTGTVYNPPNRYWSYDTNFNNMSQLPPLTPRVIYINRARWSSLSPGATSF